MSKLLGTVAVIGLAALLASPNTASAREQAGTNMKNSSSIEVSSARRYYRHYGYRHYGYRPYYRGYRSYGYYGRPYNAYAYSPYYRPYYRPGVSVGVGPLGFGFGF
jgi:hypothetical protein